MVRRALPLLLACLLVLGPLVADAAITTDPSSNRVTTSRLELDFGNAGGNIERLDTVKWRGSGGTLGANLVVNSGPPCTGTDPAEAWGHAGSLAGPPQPVGCGSGGTWTPRGGRSVEIRSSRPTLFTGESAPTPVRTRYTFFDIGAASSASSKLRVERTLSFAASNAQNYGATSMRAYIPHMPAAYSEVLHPNAANNAVATEAPNNPNGEFETDWNGKWLAINHPTTDAGLFILRETTTNPAQLSLTRDAATSNSSAADLLRPAAGWRSSLTEAEWLCFYDPASWPLANRTNPNSVPSQCTIVSVPINTAPPTITGVTRVGSQFSATSGTWDKAVGAFTFQWFRCQAGACTAIAGATSSTYTAGDADEGKQLRVDVTATAASGEKDTASSALTNGVQRGTPQSGGRVGGLPGISGEAREGETLTGSDGNWSGTPSSFNRQWMRCPGADGSGCSPISGATGSTYKLTRDDVGNTIRFRVTAINDIGQSLPVDSDPTGIVQPIILRARLNISPNPTCTGIATRIDGSGSTSPALPITRYRFSYKEFRPGFFFLLAFGATFESILAQLPEHPLADGGSPSFSTRFTWNRLRDKTDSQGKPGDYVRDFPVIKLTITDRAGGTATDESFVYFHQVYSSQSRAECPNFAEARLFQFRSVAEAVVTKSSIVAEIPCKISDPCAGQMTALAPTRRIGRRIRRRVGSARRKRAKAAVLARNAFFTIPARKKRKVAAKLTKSGRRFLRRNRGRRSVPITLRLTSVTPTGKKVTRSFRVKLRRKSNRKRKR